ncbi:MAG: hypothetical protein ACXWX6_02965 [Actinomycetota bacterium]
MARSWLRADAEPAEISAEGALAGRTFALVLIGSALGLIVLSTDELWRRCGATAAGCVERAAGAGLLTIASVLTLVWGIVIWRRVRRRVVDPEGSSRHVWALGVLFSVGLALVAAQIPSFACDRGRFDGVLRLCMHPPTTSEPMSWALAKLIVLVVGLIGGPVIAARHRAARFSRLAAVAAWVGGAGWVAVDALVLHR